MTRNSEIARAVRHALVMSAVATASVTSLSAQAQDQEQDEPVQTVTVTGSRIPLPNLTSISPITAISSEDIKAEGVTRVEDLINNLPQAFADFGGNLANGATGAATVNLRNLGSQRTLVLVNGRRLMPGDPTQNGISSPDLNQIPGALIQRVEVLTGGASAVYGADAVAGVVNFIMLDNFEGIRFDGQYSFFQHKNDNDDVREFVNARNFDLPDDNVMDGFTKDITFLAGVNTPDGKGNATVYVGYRDLSALSQSERDYSSCALTSARAAGNPTDHFICGGSSTTSPARFISDFGDFTLDPTTGALRPWGGASDQYNFAPTNYFQRPDERKTAGLFAHYDVNDHAKVYTEFMFMDDRTIAQIAPSGAFLGSGPGQPPFFGSYLLNCDNPFLSADQVQGFCNGATTGDVLLGIGKRNVEGGARQDDLRHTSYRAVVGSRGDINDTWTYDVYGLYGETILAENYLNDVSRTRLGNALLTIIDNRVDGTGAPVNPTTFGQPTCRVNADADLANDDPNCVPYNIFSLNGVTPGAIGYIQAPGFTEGTTIEQIVSGSIAGDLGSYGIKAPGATDGLGVAFGAEYRQEQSELRADLLFQTGELLGQGAPTLNTVGLFNVREVFAEARMPILQDKNFAKVLSVEAGYRYSDYSLDFSTDTYKLGADWAPVDDVRFRASYQRAVRSPNIQELYLQQRVQLDGVTDPCAGDTPEATAAQCAFTGVTPGQYGNILANPAEQYNGLVGGNANLSPETSDTYALGFVFTPQFLDGLTVAVDYFDIKVEQIVQQIGADLILANCLSNGDPTFCSLVNRSPGNGSLWLGNQGYVIDPFVNSGFLQTKGVDLDASYRFDLGGLGRLGLSLVGTFTESFDTQSLDGQPSYDCAGFYGAICGVPVPEWRHKVRANLSTPLNIDVTLTWRYIDSVTLDALSDDPQLNGLLRESDAKLGSRNYIDLSGAYTWNKVTARLGVNNLFDKDPPVFGGSSAPTVLASGNTFPQVYDALGRYVFLGLTADF